MGSVCDGHDAVTAALAVSAAETGLVLFAGAGVSMPLPTDLPSGTTLARKALAKVTVLLKEPPTCDPDSLTSLADAMEQLPGGSNTLRKAMRASADYLEAEPNEAHHAIACLFLEGAAKVVTTNWDDCIERSANPERIQVVVSDEDRLRVSLPTLFKVHGCASRPDSLKASTRELEDPNPWARAEVHSMLSGPLVIFVGIGHVADYIRNRIVEIVANVRDVSNLRIVAPDIENDWETSGWADLLPSFASEHRIEMTAVELLTNLLDAYCGLALEAAASLLGANASHFDSVREELCKLNGLELIGWIRRRAFGLRAGRPVLHSDNGKKALLAISFLPGTDPLGFSTAGISRGPKQYDIIIAPELKPASEFRREALRRAVSLKSKGLTVPDAFVCAGTIGRLPDKLGDDVVDQGLPDDMVGGPTSVQVQLINADDLIKAAPGD